MFYCRPAFIILFRILHISLCHIFEIYSSWDPESSVVPVCVCKLQKMLNLHFILECFVKFINVTNISLCLLYLSTNSLFLFFALSLYSNFSSESLYVANLFCYTGRYISFNSNILLLVIQRDIKHVEKCSNPHCTHCDYEEKPYLSC